MAEIRTFGDAVKKFHKYYSAWHSNREVWPTSADLKLFGRSDADKTSALRVIEQLHFILVDNAFADVLAECNAIDDEWRNVDEVKRTTGDRLKSQLSRHQIFKDYKDVSGVLQGLASGFYQNQLVNRGNKSYFLFYLSCAFIYNTLHRLVT